MAMQFNPYQARATLVDPTASQGGINNLLQMQQNTLSGLTDTIGNIGKTSRTNTVNDLIARGGLEGLNEAQTQARIQAEAGGTLTPEGQAQVNQLLQTAGKNDQRQFTTAERLGGEKFTGQENTTKADALYKAQTTKAVADKAEADRKYENDVKEFGIETAIKNRVADESKRHNTASERLTSSGQNSTKIAGGRVWQIDAFGNKLKDLGSSDKALYGRGSGSGKDGKTKLTGELLKEFDNKNQYQKEILQSWYDTKLLSAEPNYQKNPETGALTYTGRTLYYDGIPTTIAELEKKTNEIARQRALNAKGNANRPKGK